MASERRIQRLNKVLTQVVAEIFNREIFFGEGTFVTVTKAQVYHNMSIAEVFFTVLPESDNEKVLDILKTNIFDIQQFVNKKLPIRPVPKIIFKVDVGQEKAEEVYRLLEKAKNTKKKKSPKA